MPRRIKRCPSRQSAINVGPLAEVPIEAYANDGPRFRDGSAEYKRAQFFGTWAFLSYDRF